MDLPWPFARGQAAPRRDPARNAERQGNRALGCARLPSNGHGVRDGPGGLSRRPIHPVLVARQAGGCGARLPP